jgi:hypothetical protein
MKTIYYWMLIGSLALQVASAGEMLKRPVTFTHLSEALQFLTTTLNKDDYAGLTAACAFSDKGASLSQQRAPFDQLKAAHKTKPLDERFGKLEFPAKGDAFKLGGHGSEIGHLHVDFIRVDGKWQLKDIYQCR